VINYLRKMNVTVPDQHALHHMPEVIKLIEDEINRLNRELARFEQIKGFRILEKDFSIEDDLLTPTLKLKRKNIIARYKGLIESMYHNDLAKALQS
jgi:long-chain acyl-CoA synthetase